jgi:pilus assembly protein CpaD
VSRRFIVKDATMRSKLIFIATLGSALGACATPGVNQADRGVASVNVPVVTTADYVFDAAAPGGALAQGEAERLSGWFQGLGLGYGDTIYVDGGYAPAARAQVASIAGRYGMLVSNGAPATTGMVQPGSVRVVVARRRAEVPGCPNWSRPAAPDLANHSMSNFGCSVNSNIAAMVANPEDLLHGREGAGTTDTFTASRAIEMYRTKPPTGQGGLQDVTPKGGK